MKLAVFGKSGQLSKALQHQVVNTGIAANFYSREDCDLADEVELVKFVDAMPKVDVVVIAAAYTSVENAEQNKSLAFAVNSRAPSIIADICNRREMPIVFISTDYVFDGECSVPYQPDNSPNPINEYGRSKQEGELAIVDSGCKAAILRTTWVFDGTGRNFFNAMLDLERSGRNIKVISDQFGRPTYAGHLAEAIICVARSMYKGKSSSFGIFHVTNSGIPVSWAMFAREIFEKSGTQLKVPVTVEDISSEEYGGRAKRPLYSVLDNSQFEATFGFAMPDWREGLDQAFIERVHKNM